MATSELLGLQPLKEGLYRITSKKLESQKKFYLGEVEGHTGPNVGVFETPSEATQWTLQFIATHGHYRLVANSKKIAL